MDSHTPDSRLQALLRRSLQVDADRSAQPEAMTEGPTLPLTRAEPRPMPARSRAERADQALSKGLVSDAWPRSVRRSLSGTSRRTFVIGGVVMCGLVGVLGMRLAHAQPEVSKPTVAASPAQIAGAVGAAKSSLPDAAWAGAPSSTQPARLTVHVVGAVKKPGVVMVNRGSRVHDAVSAAGGFLDDADQNSTNLARVVNDGERVVIPRTGESGASVAKSETNGESEKVHINTATAAQLEALPGIGAVMAQRIVTWRETHGPFTSLNQLTQVKGVGAKLVKKLEGSIDL